MAAFRRRLQCLALLAAIFIAAYPSQATAADPAAVGQWGPVVDYPVVPVSAGLMPDGKIVAWDQANQPPHFGPVPANGPAMILDPATGTVERSANLAPRTLFCSLLTSLPDGRLAIIGGGTDSGGGATKDIQVYDEDSRTFSSVGMLQRPRWYPGGTIDRGGNPIVGGGSSEGIERIDQQSGAATMLNTGLPTNWYPDFIRTPDGNFAIEDIGDNAGKPIGRYMLSGTSLNPIADRTLLSNRYRGIRTMIGPYTMFWTSGGTSKESMVIDASSGSPSYRSAAPSRFPHMTGTATTLPTGDVMAIGGNSSNSATIGTPVFTPEIYSPATNTWSTMADTARQRQYHSVAMLLPDGRVWSAGTSFDGAQEKNGQFFSPPYLFKRDGSGQLAPRPSATDAPSTITAGGSFSVATGDPSQIASASLIRTSANTHQINAGQAYVKLQTTAAGNGRVQMTAPSVDEAPPGYYMLFLVDRNGVPSVAPIVRLQASGASTQPVASQSSQYDAFGKASNAIDGNRDGVYSRGSVTHTSQENQPWWQVDLGASRDLESITAHMRTDCCTDRSRDLWVFASDSPMRSTSVDGLRSQSGVTAVRMSTPSGSVGSATLQRTARYIRIQMPGTGFLSLAEVEFNRRAATPPTATIDAPAAGSSYRAGEAVALRGSGQDDQDGTLAGSALDWKVEAVSGGTTTTVHTATGATSSFSPARDREGVEYRISLTATDSSGAKTTVTRSIQPRTVPLRLASDPGGATFTWAGRQVSEPGTTTAGFQTSLSAPATLTSGGVTQRFVRWSDGVTDRSRTITVGDAGVDLTAIYEPDVAPPSGLLLGLGFDEGGGTVARDSSGAGRDAALSGGAQFTSSGRSGSGLATNGGSAMASVPGLASVGALSAMTVEAWVKPETTAGWQTVVFAPRPGWQAWTLYSAADAYGGSGRGGEPVAFVDGSGVRGPGALPVGQWSHLASTYDGSVQRLYIDGVLVASRARSGPVAAPSGPVTIGRNDVWGEGFRGTIDEVRVYGRALSAAEIETDRDTSVRGEPLGTQAPRPVAAFGFEESSGATTADASANAAVGAIAGATRLTSGRVGRALSFDGVNDRVIVPDSSALDLGRTMTLSAWVRPSASSGWRTVMLKETSNFQSYALYSAADPYGGGSAGDPAGFSVGEGVRGPSRLPLNTWSHLTMVADAGSQKLYVDGVLVATRAVSPQPSPGDGPLSIGGNGVWGEWFAGAIDEVRIFDSALSGPQVQADMARVSATASAARTSGFDLKRSEASTADKRAASRPGSTTASKKRPKVLRGEKARIVKLRGGGGRAARSSLTSVDASGWGW